MEDYCAILKQLLPPGRFFDLKRGCALDRLLKGLSLELGRIGNGLGGFEGVFSIRSSPDLFLALLGLPLSRFKTELGKVNAIESILNRQGTLSRKYVENRLTALGYADFEIVDPSDEDLGIVPVIDSKWIGFIFIKLRIQYFSELTVEFSAGDPIVEWRNLAFENDLNRLIPAHIRATFLYQKEEIPHASS